MFRNPQIKLHNSLTNRAKKKLRSDSLFFDNIFHGFVKKQEFSVSQRYVIFFLLSNYYSILRIKADSTKIFSENSLFERFEQDTFIQSIFSFNAFFEEVALVLDDCKSPFRFGHEQSCLFFFTFSLDSPSLYSIIMRDLGVKRVEEGIH